MDSPDEVSEYPAGTLKASTHVRAILNRINKYDIRTILNDRDRERRLADPIERLLKLLPGLETVPDTEENNQMIARFLDAIVVGEEPGVVAILAKMQNVKLQNVPILQRMTAVRQALAAMPDLQTGTHSPLEIGRVVSAQYSLSPEDNP